MDAVVAGPGHRSDEPGQRRQALVELDDLGEIGMEGVDCPFSLGLTAHVRRYRARIGYCCSTHRPASSTLVKVCSAGLDHQEP